jgi:hypothetical protein
MVLLDSISLLQRRQGAGSVWRQRIKLIGQLGIQESCGVLRDVAAVHVPYKV